MKPDPTNVRTNFDDVDAENELDEGGQPSQSPPIWNIEYQPEDPDEESIAQGQSSATSTKETTKEFASVIPNIKLPSEMGNRPKTSPTSSSQSSDSEPEAPKVDVNVEPPHRAPSDSSSPSISRSEPPINVKIPLVIPPIPDDVAESEIVAGADDVELENGWRRKVKLSALQRTRLIDRSTVEKYLVGDISKEELMSSLKQYLDGEEPIAGIVMMDTGEKKSIYKAAKEGYIRRGTAISILEAQAATGNIIDPLTGEKMCVTDAAQNGLLDKIYEQCLLRAERAVSGYKTRLTDDKLSIFEAMTRGLVVEEHAIRLLESQLATGGIIDVRNNHRVPVEYALKRGLIDERIYRILREEQATKSFEDPNTDEKVNYEELMGRCILDMDTGLRLLPFEKPSFEKIPRSQSSSPISSTGSFQHRLPSIGSITSKQSKDLAIDLAAQKVDDDILKPPSEAEKEPKVDVIDETKSITSKSSRSSKGVAEPEQEVIKEAKVLKLKKSKINIIGSFLHKFQIIRLFATY